MKKCLGAVGVRTGPMETDDIRAAYEELKARALPSCKSRPSDPTALRPCFATVPRTGSASTSTSGMPAERTVDAYVAARPDGFAEDAADGWQAGW